MKTNVQEESNVNVLN